MEKFLVVAYGRNGADRADWLTRRASANDVASHLELAALLLR